MRVQVREDGVTIPRQLFEGVREVEIRSKAEAKHKSGTAETLAERQYRLARQHPDDWVVLVGERIVHHSADRAAAFRAFDEVFTELPGARPVIVEPGGGKRRMPIVRGRSIKMARA